MVSLTRTVCSLTRKIFTCSCCCCSCCCCSCCCCSCCCWSCCSFFKTIWRSNFVGVSNYWSDDFLSTKISHMKHFLFHFEKWFVKSQCNYQDKYFHYHQSKSLACPYSYRQVFACHQLSNLWYKHHRLMYFSAGTRHLFCWFGQDQNIVQTH